MKYKFVDSKFLAKCANIIDKSINLSLIGLLIIPILSVACNDVNSTAYAQLLSNNLSTKAASSQSPAGQIRILLENAVLEISNNDTSKALANINLVDRQLVALGNSPAIQSLNVIVKDSAGLLQVGSTDKALVRLDQASQQLAILGTNNERTHVGITSTKPFLLTGNIATTRTPTMTKTSALSPSHITTPTSAAIISQSTPISSNTTGISPVASSNAQCMVIPGPAMTFREICPNQNNATTPGRSVVQTPQQPAPGTYPHVAPPLSSARAPTPTNPGVNSTTPLTPLAPPLQQSPLPVNPPLIPSNANGLANTH